MGRLGELARKHGVGIHTHLCSVPGEAEFMQKVRAKKSIPLLRELGMLGPDFIGAHCVFMDEEDTNLVYNANGSDVTYVLVDGELLVDDGRLTRLGERELIAEAQAVAEDVWRRSAHLFAAEGMR